MKDKLPRSEKTTKATLTTLGNGPMNIFQMIREKIREIKLLV